MNYTLTPWFQQEIKPAHIGVYPVRFDAPKLGTPGRMTAEGYSHWNGFVWGMCMPTVDKAFEFRVRNGRNRTYAAQSKEWRGFAQNPAEVV